MTRRVDTRDPNAAGPVNPQDAQFASIVAGNPGEPPFQNMRTISGFTGAPLVYPGQVDAGSAASMIDRATNFVRNSSAAYSATDGPVSDFLPDPTVGSTGSNANTVHLQQHYRGIPVFQMHRIVRFAPNGELRDAAGSDVNLPPNLDVNPRIVVTDAAQAAVSHLAQPEEGATDSWGQPAVVEAIDPAAFKPLILSAFPFPSRPTVLDKSIFEEAIPAYLLVFHQGAQARLGWHFIFSLPSHEQYEVIVGADIAPPEILYCEQTSWSMAVRGRVFLDSPGRSDAVEMAWPPGLDHYPLQGLRKRLPSDFPQPWVRADDSSGNAVLAVQAGTFATLKGARINGDIVFSANNLDEQKIANIFYFCCYMHDFFYQLGFDESAGNFQEINFTGSGFGNDAVLAQAHQQPFNGTATMKTQVDGVRAVMNMGPIAGQDRHSSLDADVVFHEYVHGVTNRLVGGRLNDRALQAPQSRGMGEGWSDYFALTIQNHGKTRERVITGDWLSGRPHGIRMHRYDEHYPSGFGSLGKTPYDREHNIGEIWCAALMQMNRNACKALGGDIGHEICWQLVVDALKLTPANPSFLDGRDALVLALDDMRDRIVDPLPLATYRLLRRALWQAFAKFEMGPGAVSNGASLTGCFPDTNLPHDL